MSSDSNNGDDARDEDGEGRDRDRFVGRPPEQDDRESIGPHDDDGPPEVIGYGRPPKGSRVVKGQVLNPRGRPKGSKNRKQTPLNQDLWKVILEEAHRMIPLGDVDGTVSIPMVQAIVRATLVTAAKGNTRAQRLAADLIRTAELETNRERDREIEIALDYKGAWNRELARRKRLGIKGPAPLPHPNHVVIDLARGCVWIKGPATEEEKAAWRRWEQYRDETIANLHDLQAERDDPNCPDSDGLEGQIEGTRATLEIIGYALDGHREAMDLLEEVFIGLGRTHPDVFADPQEV
jgi:hypothetical protein